METSSLSRNSREAMTELTNWITKACDKTIPKTHINGWREITWWTYDLTKMKKQTHLYRRRLNKTHDLEARERAQNAFRNSSKVQDSNTNRQRKYLEEIRRGQHEQRSMVHHVQNSCK
jgi:hypothetical protein